MLYRRYLFFGFLNSFRKLFSLPNYDNPQMYSFFSWSDEVYHNFMMDILRTLEPRQENANTYLFKELEDVNEVIFFNKGSYDIGFEFNAEEHFKVRYQNSNLIGAFNCTFHKKSQFIYKTFSRCTGWFIRKTRWIEMIYAHEAVSDEFQDMIKKDYVNKESKRLNIFKSMVIKNTRCRKDIEQFKYVIDGDFKGFDEEKSVSANPLFGDVEPSKMS